MVSIAKKEEIRYVLGQDDEPVILDRHLAVLHLIQQVRDGPHRFAVGLSSSSGPRGPTDDPRCGYPGDRCRNFAKIAGKRYGSVANWRRASAEELSRSGEENSGKIIAATFVACHKDTDITGMGIK